MKNIFLVIGLICLVSFSFAEEAENIEAAMPEPAVDAEMPTFEGEVPPEFIHSQEDHEQAVDDSDVLVLTEATFDEAIKGNKYILVEFYARN